MATDLEDNVGLTGPFDLHGAAVLVLAFEGSSAERTRQLRQDWESRLKAARASVVVYRDATEPGTENLDDLARAAYELAEVYCDGTFWVDLAAIVRGAGEDW